MAHADASSSPSAKETALRLVARAEQSSVRLALKLRLRGFSRAEAEAAVRELCEDKLVDDLRYARLWAVSRLRRRPENPRSLYQKLRARGIAAEPAREGVRAALDAQSESSE